MHYLIPEFYFMFDETFERRPRNILIIVKLVNSLYEKFIPRLFKLSIARVLVAVINPLLIPSSMHPFTVNVSKPNDFSKRNKSDSELIERWYFESELDKEVLNKLISILSSISSRYIIIG